MEVVIELAVIAAAVWPLVRLCTTPPFIRKLRSFPGRALGLVACWVAGIASVVIVTVAYPAMLRVIAVLAGIVVLALAWRARPAYGRSRGLPPGSLGVLPVGPLVDDRFFLRQGNRYGPIFKTSQFMRPMVCVIGLERCQELLRRYDDQLTPPALPFDRFIDGGFIRSMPAAAHDRYAPLLRAAMPGDAMGDFDNRIAVSTRKMLDDMVHASASANGRGVAPRPYLEDMLFATFLQMFFGIVPGSGAAEMLREQYRTIDVRKPSGALRHQAVPAVEKIADLVRKNGQLDHEEQRVVQSNLIYIVQNARNDTAGLLVWVLKMLGDHPAWADQLRSSVSTDLAKRIIQETLRLEQSEFLFRIAQADLRCEGFFIPKGWLVRLCVRESHRSPGVFHNPTSLTPDRFLSRSPGRAEYSPFGAYTSRHRCMGEQITKAIGVVFLESLSRNYVWRVVSDGPREFDGWHWTPSSRFRITVEPRFTVS
jgi:cytochrome P450